MQLTIYHSNDIHSNYDNLKKINTYLKKHKKKDDLYLDSGDFMDLKDLIVQSDHGLCAIKLLKNSFLDAMCIGNNEIDLGYDDLGKVARTITMLSCNLRSVDGNRIAGILDSIVINRYGLRILIVGVSPFYNAKMENSNFNCFYNLYNLNENEPFDAIKKAIAKQKGNYDYCILISHSGLVPELNFLKEIPEIDLILGGHSHNICSQDKYSQSGKGECLGKIIIDTNTKQIIVNEQIELIDEDNKEFDNLLNDSRNYANKLLSVDLKACENLPFDPYKECPLINFTCDCLYKLFDGDFAIMHNGIATCSLEKPVTWKKVIECFPSKLNPTMYKLSGRNIYEAIKQSFDEKHIHQDGSGAAFRGNVLGTLSFSHNVTINKDTLEVFINNEALDLNKEYNIITDDYLQRGTGYQSMKVPDIKAKWHKWYIRDMIKNCIKDQEIYKTAKIKRIK